MLQRTEEHMSQHATDGFAAWKIQYVDEIIPTWVRIKKMLVSSYNRIMETEVLVYTSHFKGAIAKRGESAFNGDKSTFWSKVLLVEGCVETERAERKNIENRLLAHRFSWHRRYEYEHNDQKMGNLGSQCATSQYAVTCRSTLYRNGTRDFRQIFLKSKRGTEWENGRPEKWL